MSICSSVSGNTYSTALVIGEKAADIIVAQLEIGQKQPRDRIDSD